MPSDRTKRRLATFGIFAAPLVLVKSAAWMFGSPGPAVAEATDGLAVVAPADDVSARPAGPTEAQRRAMTHIRALREIEFGLSPMFWIQLDEAGDPTPVPGELTFEVQAIMRGEQGTVVVINGRVYRAGDRVGEGRIEIIAIDTEARSVTVRELATGREVTRSVRRPEGG